jgi:inorganic phosphate transporter, PiT family
VPGIITIDIDVQTTMMLGSSFASVAVIMTSSIFGIPISGTHTVVGALIGAGLAVSAEVDWS